MVNAGHANVGLSQANADGFMTGMNNNVNVAILMRVNELASRYGIEPYDFVAVLQDEIIPNPNVEGGVDQTGRTVLNYSTMPEDRSKFEKFELMLESIGASNETGILAGTDEELIKALDNGLRVAPRARPRA